MNNNQTTTKTTIEITPQKEQELKNEFENTMLKAIAILRKVGKEGTAEELEIMATEINYDWYIPENNE